MVSDCGRENEEMVRKGRGSRGLLSDGGEEFECFY